MTPSTISTARSYLVLGKLKFKDKMFIVLYAENSFTTL